ncbi:hypothetical protein [Sphingomonas hengshuiensis]|uniref:hypothetical protein n=1 Tax=Sphingomonas hengshuiensis TaxID=1609977 RepID=UPI0012B7A7B5|nr:hypothetical protein [Sphingomonas hengshuiensis]
MMRYISAAKRWVHPDTLERGGPSLAGFKLREEDNGGLSVTEVEYFGDFSYETRAAAAVAHRHALQSKKLGSQAIFAWAKVDDVIAAGTIYGKKLRIVHDPVAGNPGHAEVRHFKDDDLDILDHFASNVFVEFAVVAEMGLP